MYSEQNLCARCRTNRTIFADDFGVWSYHERAEYCHAQLGSSEKKQLNS